MCETEIVSCRALNISPNVHARENRNDTPRKRKTHIIKVIPFLDKNSQFLSEKLHGIKSAVRRICCAQYNGAIARLHLYQSDRRRKTANRIRLQRTPPHPIRTRPPRPVRRERQAHRCGGAGRRGCTGGACCLVCPFWTRRADLSCESRSTLALDTNSVITF